MNRFPGSNPLHTGPESPPRSSGHGLKDAVEWALGRTPAVDYSHVITLDGLPRTGKTTLGRALAEKYNGIFASSGLVYRAISYLVLAEKKSIQTSDIQAVRDFVANLELEGLTLPKETPTGSYREMVLKSGNLVLTLEFLQGETTGERASALAKASARQKKDFIRLAVREVIHTFIRKNFDTWLILDGRDMGRSFPEAGAKLFLTVSPEEAVNRALKSAMEDKVPVYEYRSIADKVRERAIRDAQQTKPPIGSFPIDTSLLDPASVLLKAQTIIEQATSPRTPQPLESLR